MSRPFINRSVNARFQAGKAKRHCAAKAVATMGCLLLGCFSPPNAPSAPPTLDYLFPPGLKRGVKSDLTVGGKFDPWPVSAWTDAPGVSVTAETNNGKFSVQIGENVPPGPHLLRLYNQDGASAPRWFIITRERDELEKEPNDSVKNAQRIEKLPTAIAGRLEKSGDVDSFAVRIEAGKWLVARVDAFSLGSPVDAVLHLFDDKGTRLAFNHDSARSLDPLLAFKIERSGNYTVQVAGFVQPPAADIKYAGSPATIYRLVISDGPFAVHCFPSGVRRGDKAPLNLLGWNLETAGKTSQPLFDGAALASEIDEAFVAPTLLDERIPVVLGDVAEQIETEPNDTWQQAQPVSVPCAVNGRISHANDQDRFRFAARKGDRFEFRVQSASLGFPLSATLEVADDAGKQLARADDRGGPDPKLTWTAPAEGSYIITIADLYHKGGDDFVYHLLMAPPKPDFRVTVDEHAIRLEPGKTNEIKVQVTRINGHTNALVIEVEGLPEDVRAKIPELGGKSGEMKLALIADPDTEPANQPIRISVRAADSSTPRVRHALFDLRGKEPKGDRLINETDQLWLTIIPKPAPPAAKSETTKPSGQ